ncbi:OmpW/AlkL family protein [Neptunicella marina]|uniref:Outer membrane beta-barrel protein n=1 Tax=Neptunicella marina TaxID=2125989 RepID=A0A8J6IVJ8_9ALTE|nr:OmpW family outer membrane protein [Neptunicella marina]MBC3766605.1 outer membrane beta-barrel protein [Neptunicella marina]
MTVLNRNSITKALIVAGLISWAGFANAGDFIVRAGLTTVAPQVDSSNVTVDGVGNVGMGVDVDNNTQLGLNFVYRYNANWALEVLAATPFKHDITLEHTTDNELGLGDGTLAETKHLPPTVSALYYFNTSSEFQPYVGLGVNYTVFFDEEFKDARQQQTFSDLKLDNSWGLSAQVGFDYALNDKWLVNASARYIDINTEANFTVLDLPAKVSADIDPWVYSITLGYRF